MAAMSTYQVVVLVLLVCLTVAVMLVLQTLWIIRVLREPVLDTSDARTEELRVPGRAQ